MARRSRNKSEDIKIYAPRVARTRDHEYVSLRRNHDTTPPSDNGTRRFLMSSTTKAFGVYTNDMKLRKLIHLNLKRIFQFLSLQIVVV